MEGVCWEDGVGGVRFEEGGARVGDVDEEEQRSKGNVGHRLEGC